MKQVIKNRKYLYNLSKEYSDLVKKELTFTNPKAIQVKKYSKYLTTKIPDYLYYYSEDTQGNLSVPIGFNLNFKKLFSNIDLRVSNIVNYPEFLLKLRIDQDKAEKEYLEKKYGVIQLPTGKGKTILALHIAFTLKQKTLILVHKDDLVRGWIKDIKKCFGNDIPIGLIKAKNKKIGEQLTIATVQTLSRMSKDELSKYTEEFGLVVQDECHHVGLNIFNIIDQFNSKYKLGLSATPERTDGLNFVFDLFFGGIIYKQIIKKDDPDICNAETRILNSDFKYEPFLYKNQVYNYFDYEKDKLPSGIIFLKNMDYKNRPVVPFSKLDDIAVTDKSTMDMVCNIIYKHYKYNHSILVLFKQKRHIDLYYNYLIKYNDILKERIILYYGNNKENCDILLQKAENKDALITLATYAKATEGTDVKSWEVLFLVSSINNMKNVEQAVGRIKRKVEGKLDTAIVYDVRYSNSYILRNHGYIRDKVYTKLKMEIKR